MSLLARARAHGAEHAEIYRLAAAIAAAALLVGLFVLTQPVDLRRHNTLLGYFGQMKSDEARLGEAVLELNFSLANNYDQVTAIIGRLDDTLRQLHQGDAAADLRREGDFQAQLQALQRRIDAKGDALEKFKSRNAVLKNSLIYLPHARDELVRELPAGAGVRERLDNLIEFVLLNRLNGALLDRGGLDQAIAALEARAERLPAAPRRGCDTLVRHIRQIDQFERELPELVQQLTSHAADDGLATAYQRYYDRQQQRAVAYRSFLLLATLVLLGYTVRSFIRLREFSAELERRVRERTQLLEQANKSLESFSYSVSHDLRAPLRAINGYAKILLDEERQRLSPEGGKLLEQLARNADKLGDLINDILEYSRAERQVLEPTDVDMGGLIRGLVEESRQAYPAVRFEVGPLPAVRGDPTMLRQIFQNLIDNACKFSARGERPAVTVSAGRAGGDAVLQVRDNGAGFDMRYADKLFGMFQRLHPANEFPGTGVGLSIVKRLVDRHGGRISAEAEPGRGAVFSVRLQAATADRLTI